MDTLLTMNLERQRDELALMTQPRTVSVAWDRLTPGLFILCIWIVFLFLAWEETARSLRTSLFSVAIFPAVTIMIAWAFVRGVRDEIAARQLLTTGDCAVARVILQEWKGRRRMRSEICYEFKNEQGTRYHGTGDDLTHTCSVGSSVLVFYLRANPAQNIASCCTVWQVRARDGCVFEP